MKKKQVKKVPALQRALKEGCEQPDPVTGHWVLERVSRKKDNSKSDESSDEIDEIDEIDGYFEGRKWLDSLWLE